MAERTTIRYHVKKGGKIVHRGQTSRSLDERGEEHKGNYGKKVHIVKIGPKVTKKSALKWERDGGKRPVRKKSWPFGW